MTQPTENYMKKIQAVIDELPKDDMDSIIREVRMRQQDYTEKELQSLIAQIILSGDISMPMLIDRSPNIKITYRPFRLAEELRAEMRMRGQQYDDRIQELLKENEELKAKLEAEEQAKLRIMGQLADIMNEHESK